MFQPFHRSHTIEILPHLSLHALRLEIIGVILLVSVTAVAAPSHNSLALLDTVETVLPKDSGGSGAPSSSGSVGLVLSGGGAKGIAHVGVIKALEDHGIPIDYVVGTSMGAVVGSLYSCGWSPAEMLAFFMSKDFRYWAFGQLNPSDIYYFSEPSPSPKWLSFNISFKKQNNLASQILPASLISPLPMNIEFLKLYTPYTVQCGEDFRNLFVPFQCVTSDIYHKHKVVLRNGSLGDAVRASMSFPLVYRPIEIDSLLMFDGGIYDNFPVDVMREDFHPDVIIGVSVSEPDGKPKPGNAYSQLEDMIIQNNDYSLPSSEGIKIQVPVSSFSVLDFEDAAQIYEIGYDTGLAMVDSVAGRVKARRPLAEVSERRRLFAAKTPSVEFDSVAVKGATQGEARFLRFLFDHGRKTPFSMEDAYESYYRAVAGGKLDNLLPQSRLNLQADSLQALAYSIEFPAKRPVVSANTLLLDAKVKNPWNFGVGGWITTSTNSMLYFTCGYHTLSFNSLDIDLSAWVGQSYYAALLSGKMAINSQLPSYIQLEGVLSRQKYYDSELLFYQTGSPSFITDTQHFARLNYCVALGRAGKGLASIGYGYLGNRYYPVGADPVIAGNRQEGHYHIFAARLEAELNTLDFQQYPSSGMKARLSVIGSREKSGITSSEDKKSAYEFHNRLRLFAEWQRYFPLLRNVSLGVSASGVATFSRLYQNYTATLIHASAFEPTPSTKNYFNPAFRSDNYVAAGLQPVWSPFRNFQLRGDFNLFLPVRSVRECADGMPCWDGWFRHPEFIGELAAVYNFKFASLSLYGNYLSSPARNWNFGINFGLYFQAPKFVR